MKWGFKKSTQSGEEDTFLVFKCPYCFCELEKAPTRNQSCRFCGKGFVVRTHYVTKQKLVLTGIDAKKFDVEKEKYYIDKSLIDGLKNFISIDKGEIDKMVEEVRIELTQKFGQPASLGDIAWSLANKMLIQSAKNSDTGLPQDIQFQMALYLHKSGKDGNLIRENSFFSTLWKYKKLDINKVEILSSSGCDECKKLNGVILNIDEAIKNKILPCKKCTFKFNDRAPTGWCRCCYGARPDL